MADYVELVIKIYKNTYDRITSKFADGDDIVLFENLLKNGTLLPKGHGELVDRSKLSICPIDITDLPRDKCLMVYLADDVDNAKVIIEADKESKNV